MYVVIEYIKGVYKNINFLGKDEKVMLFNSEQDARKEARENCAFSYKIVEI